MRLGFCLISRQQIIGFLNRFFLLKTEIHTQIFNSKPFLCDFRGPRYLQNKIEFLTKAIVINSTFSYFHLSGILKDDKNENKLKHIYPVGTTYVILEYFGGCQCQSGASQRSFCQFGVSTVLSGPLQTSIKLNLSVSEPNIVSSISRPPKIVQKWFCIQNLRIDLSFQEKKII